MNNLTHRLVWLFLSCLFLSCFLLIIFMPIFITDTLIFPYAITPFDICKEYPKVWLTIKKLYWICFFISYFISYNYFYNNIQKYLSSKITISKRNIEPFSSQENSLELLVGIDSLKNVVYIPENGLYQNILITGTIGSRKNFFCNVPFYWTINKIWLFV